MAIGAPVHTGATLAQDWQPVTVSDTVDLVPAPCVGLSVGSAGNVAIVSMNNNVVTLTVTTAGSFLPCRCRRVNSTGTTAGAIVAMY